MNVDMTKNIKYLFNSVLVNHKQDELDIKTYAKNDFIIKESNPINHIYFIVSGKIKVYKEYENGKTLLLQFVNGICSMGDLEYINEMESATGSVKAVNEVKLFMVSYQELRERYEDNKNFNNYLIRHLSKRFLSSNNKAGFNLIYSLETRLSSYILSMSNNMTKTGVTLDNLQDLSDNLGSSYRHLHRALKELTSKGVIERHRNHITILNINKLEELARGNIYEDSFNETGN